MAGFRRWFQVNIKTTRLRRIASLGRVFRKVEALDDGEDDIEAKDRARLPEQFKREIEHGHVVLSGV